MTSATILAIDPGVTGALAFLSSSAPHHVTALDMPVVDGEVDALELRRLIYEHLPSVAFVERVNAMPGDGTRKMGASSAFNFGAAAAMARATVLLSKVPMHLVAPTVWKKHFRIPSKTQGGDEAARALALQRFPACADQFRRKKDHGRADAALLALYGASVVTGAAGGPA